MATTLTYTDLAENYNEISRICHETKEPVYITKNGQKDLVVLSNEAYEEYDKKMSECEYEMFYKEYPNFESFKKDLYEKIEIGLKQAKEELDSILYLFPHSKINRKKFHTEIRNTVLSLEIYLNQI